MCSTYHDVTSHVTVAPALLLLLLPARGKQPASEVEPRARREETKESEKRKGGEEKKNEKGIL